MITTKKVEKITLNGIWKLQNKQKSVNIEAEVPGTVFEALLHNSLINDPFYGSNEHEINWVYESDWYYEKELEVSSDFLEYSNILLRFHGLDTIAEVYLNDELIGKTDNMFVIYDFEVKGKLRDTHNTLKIIFKSPTRIASEMVEKYKIELKTTHTNLGLPYIRKAQYSFGWDWGPILPDIGIWKSVELIGFNDIIIDSVYQTQTFKYNKDPLSINRPDEISTINIENVKIKIQIGLLSKVEDISSGGYTLKVMLIDPKENHLELQTAVKSKSVTVETEINDPQLWWTHNLGAQNLYELTICIQKGEIILDSSTQNIGIRDIQHVRRPDKWGECFYFMLNGIPLFAKGANWIPIDSLIPRGKKAGLYQSNLESAKKANMNMIRVWGGGIYEDDLFYELCNKLGILVWQDFPFACAIYPVHKEFFETVEREAIQNIKRLRNHACLAIWCGNNEIEQLWGALVFNAKLKDPETIALYEKAYLDMFKGLIPKLINKYDPSHSYWPSSALDTWDGKKIRSKNPDTPDTGDSHFWKVWHGGASFKAYQKFNSRFMSEFGFESFPSMKTIKTFCPPDQFDFNTPIMENHQKNPAGNRKILSYMRRRFSIPKTFEQQVILSQITQAEAIEYGVEHWRRNRNGLHCMGSLYWQLNDCWPVASWSSLDYSGRWKALHYFAKRFYQPLFPSVKVDKQNVEFWITNDLAIQKDFALVWKILDYESNILKKGAYDVKISPCYSLIVGTIDVSDINQEKDKMQN
ncbi:MAG: glycoside hydrolase family 2 protein, partial [Promethearchaeota archaeon]